MNKVYACVGRYASNPYTIKNVGIRVYCVEELCYYIRHNALFIEDDFFDAQLFLWLEDECDLQSLSRKIKAKLRVESKVEVGVRELFDNVNYCDDAETEETVMLLKSNRDMSVTDRLKIHGDYFLNNNKLTLAAGMYQELCSRLDKNRDRSLLANVYYNLGVVFARLFMFENAGECFRNSYELKADDKTMEALLCSMRLRMNDETYLKNLNNMANAYSVSGKVEERIKQIENQYLDSTAMDEIKQIRKYKLEGNMAEYEKKAIKLSSEYKDEYRNMMQN